MSKCTAHFLLLFLASVLSGSTASASPLESGGIKEFSVALVHAQPWTSGYQKVAKDVMGVMGKQSCPNQPQNCGQDLVLLDKLISENPKQAFLHAVKATYLMISKTSDARELIAEIDLGLDSPSQDSNLMSIPVPSLLQMRAKADFNNKEYDQAVRDLMKAVRLAGEDFFLVFDTGGVKPTDAGNSTSLNGADFDSLVEHLPGDWKPLAMRGLFKLSFWRFDTEAMGNSLGDLNQAMSLAPDEVSPKRFLARAYEIAAFQEIKEQQKAMLYQRSIQLRKAALKFVPQSFEDCAALGENLLSTGQFQTSIEYYSRAIALDPNNSVTLNGRGVAEERAGKLIEAIQDFTAAIANLQLYPKKESSLKNNYEHRADVNLKLGKTKSAIEDYGSAIGYQLADSIFLMSVSELRDLYPELADMPDMDLLEQMRIRYFPEMEGETFSRQLKTNNKFQTFLLGDLYTARANAEKAIGDNFSSNKDFARASIMINK